MPYIISTLSSNVTYAVYGKATGGLPIVKKEITVNGGTGVLNKTFVTPNGVVTEVSDADLEILEAHPLFKRHKDNGFIKIVKSPKVDTSNMAEKDSSAQLVEKDFTKKGKKAPKVAKK